MTVFAISMNVVSIIFNLFVFVVNMLAGNYVLAVINLTCIFANFWCIVWLID